MSQPEDQLLRALALAQLDHLLGNLDEFAGDALTSARIHLTRANEHWSLNLHISRNATVPAPILGPPSPGAAPPNGRALSRKHRRVHRKILEKATPQPTPAKVLIKLAGYKLNTYARDAITDLVRDGYLIRLPEGLVLPRAS